MDSKIKERISRRVWTYVGEGKDEEVPVERWVWGALYEDGSELHQFDEAGYFHRFAEIEMEKLKYLSIYQSDNMGKRIDIPKPEKGQIFFFYRNIKPHYDQSHFHRVFVFGTKVDGVASYMFMLPDDRMVFSNTDSIDLSLYGV